MKREIKFRAWDKNNKSLHNIWMLDFDCGFKNAKEIGIEIEEDCLTKYRVSEQDNFILMQFTGLLDKNGKEIYEGDIVEYITDPLEDSPYNKEIEVIEWENGSFYIPNNCEVIGNIYENPELINLEKNES